MAQVPSNLIPTTVTQLQTAPVADENSLMMIVYQGVNYKIRVGDLLSVAGVPTSRQVIAGTGLQGGGALSSNVTLSIAPGGVGTSELSNTGVTPGVYGSSSRIPVLTVDAQGRVDAASTAPFSSAMGGTVTSVDVSGGSTGLTTSGGPVIDDGVITLAGTLNVANGGTSATDAAGARANLSAAVLGTNNDITSMTGVTGGISTPDFVQLDTAAAATIDIAKLRWNIDTATASFGIIDGTQEVNIGQQMYARVTNADAATLTRGQAVYLYQATGNRASVKLAANTGDATSAKTLGLVVETIAPGGTGFVITQGVLDKLDTSAFAEGATLYLGVTPGSWTSVKPQAPNHLVYLGVVERANAGNGQVYVRPQNGYELDEIHDVRITSVQNNDLLQYNSSGPYWQNVAASSVTVGTASATANAVTFTNTGGAAAGTTFNGSAARTVDYSTLGAPKADGTGASGTWGISISGNAATATTATTATNLAGGAASRIPYQTGADTTGFIANGTAGQVLVSAGAAAPAWGGVNGGTF